MLIFVLCLSCFRVCSLLPCGHLLERKGLTSWLLFVILNCVFVTFPCGILSQVLYLIVSIFDLCRNRGVSHYRILPVSRDIGWPVQQLDYFRYIKQVDLTL